jgi:Fe-S-cluster containining protein
MSQLVETSKNNKLVTPPQAMLTGVVDTVSEQQAPEITLERLRDNVAEGFMYSHSRANANTSKVLEVASFSYALIELLMERGVISVEELDERKKQVGQRLVEKFAEKGMGVALTNDDEDKYSYEGGVQIDCANRLHLCRGACCRLSFALTVQDLEEGRVKWDLGRPYMIRHDSDGYCHHVERETKGCRIYENRPVVCRAYDCRKDKRIWEDFENRVVSPDLENLFRDRAAATGKNVASDGDSNGSGEPVLYQLTRTPAHAEGA